jgi:ABC-2 type transport system permease protein
MLTLYKSIFLIELRKIITYRSDFWINFIGRTFFTITIAYFLWDSIFESLKTESLNGYTIDSMIIYYLLAPLIFRIQQGSDIGTISKDIYEGGLNKFLVYPVNFYLFKLTTYLTHSFFYFFQLIIIIAIYKLTFTNTSELVLSLTKVCLFIPAITLCSICYFLLTSIIELISFWADNIWSLNVIMRFIVAFSGGVFIPLSFFPDTAIELLSFTPFPYLISFPIQILLTEVSLSSYLGSMLALIIWGVIFSFASILVWKKGKYKYTGVGI